VLGFPALSIPSGQSSEGLPIGLQIIGRPFEENMLLMLGEALE
jgi:aspartyl-tRNA(Asn)/glutamyl-tRNA(Gln) amidotransferase subunit A